MWMLAGLLAWVAASTYWYVCEIRQFCEADKDVKVEKRELNALAPIPAYGIPVHTADATWQEVIAAPLVVHFAANSDRVLTEEVEAKLTDIVAYMQTNKDAKILVTGHTNVHSSSAYTDALGKTRAEKVKELLVAQGAPAGSIATSSMGQREIVGSPATAEGRYENRRAVISVIQ
jgi:OmpA-OmpF porin, OOP family